MFDFKAQKAAFLAAFAIVSNPNTWCQDSYALDSDGDTVPSLNIGACKWCSAGAIAKVVGVGGHDDGLRYSMGQFTNTKHKMGLVDFNDAHTHAEVVEMWREFGNTQGFFN
jgi:hypothetical protein